MKKAFLLLNLIFCSFSYANTNDIKTTEVTCPGGNGTSGTEKSDGLPGCDGGTNPSEDGKFYIKKTHKECNPSQCDLDRANNSDGLPVILAKKVDRCSLYDINENHRIKHHGQKI